MMEKVGLKMKAIIKEKELENNFITLKIIPDTDTENRFLTFLIQNESFIIKTSDSIGFIIDFAKCDNCEYNYDEHEVDGTKSGKDCKIKVGRCNCPDKSYVEKLGLHILENEFRNCKHYKKKEKKI